MSMLRLIEAVLFDVDGVVVESELLHMKTFNELLEPLGIQLTEEEWKTRFLGAGSAMIMTALFNEHGILEDPIPWINRRRELYRQHVVNGDLKPIPGFLPFYESIQNIQLPTAFVSTSHPTNLNAALASLGIEGKHPTIDGTQVSRLKPDPEAYYLGAQTLSVPPSRCLVFEDSPIGVSAAKAATMICVALTTTNPAKDLSEADLIIPDFIDWTIHTIIEKLGGKLEN